ncbi:MAG: adenylate/guanylate cyclase domain-containing protein [Proteobacteria bacterium]|nr:adenylate/guanylate cyclase domain-containing protein [Pseudomonadota bacterium]
MATRFQKQKRLHALLMAFLISVAALYADLSGLFESFERKTIDMRTRLCRVDTHLPDDIVIVLIDDSSLQALNDIAGRWPWPRYIHADLIDYLAQSGAESIIMDIMFFENQINEKQTEQELDPNDARLAQATLDAGNVIHAIEISNDFPDEYNTTLLDKPLPQSMVQQFAFPCETDLPLSESNVCYLPFEQLLMASAGLGVVSFSADEDGINRSEQLLFDYQDHFFPTHALSPILRKWNIDSAVIEKNQARLVRKNKDDLLIPLENNNEYYVNMYGHYNTFSYSGVIESLMKLQAGITDNLMVPPDEFAGKIVYVGASASATHDLKNTSMGNHMPGVFLHASICGNILTRDYLIFSGFFTNALCIVPLLFFCVFSILFMKKIYFQIYLPLGLALLYAALAVMVFKYNRVIHMAIPLSSMFLAYFLSFTYISFTEGKEKRKVKNILGQYVSPAMLTQVLENSKDEYLKAEVGSKEYLTVFFSDIRDFTSISEKYPVERVVETLNAYLSKMVDIIFDNNGTLDKFIGDAIVAFWGAPVRFDDHPRKAVLSALEMIKALGELNKENQRKGLPELKIGIGIHTDHVILGNIGSRKKLDYTVIGDGVNLTSRLEGLTKNYGCPILISQPCFDHIKDTICCRMADHVQVKGKDEPISIYHVLGPYETIDPWTKSLADKTDRAFDLYCKGQFQEAKQIYTDILLTDPDDSLIQIFSRRCDDFIEQPPGEGWVGCFVHTTK